MTFLYKLGLLCYAFFITQQINAQTINPDELIGNWGVANVQLLNNNVPEEKKQMVDSIRNAFLNSNFNFTDDHNFSLDMEYEGARIEGGHWKYDEDSNAILIQKWEDKDTDERILMELLPTNQSGKFYFMVAESPFILEMKSLEK